MKKFFTVVLSGMLFVCAAGMSACGNNGHTHSYTKASEVGASCTEDAYTLMKCSCGESRKEYDANSQPLGHDFASYLSDGNKTCTKDGTKTAKCSRCNETDTKPDAAQGHIVYDYEDNNDATCTQEGTRTGRCEECRENVVVPAPALGHDFRKYVSDNNATCSAYGTKTAKCERCDEKKTFIDSSSKLPHRFEGGVCKDCSAAERVELAYKLVGKEYRVVGIGTVEDAVVVIPAEYNGKPVTSIGDYAFEDCQTLTGVTISEGITSIGSSAFSGCKNLTSVTVPDSVISIGADAFKRCGMNKTTSEGVEYMELSGNPYFYLCDGTTVQSCTVHADTKFIANEAFADNEELTSVIIPEGVIGIGRSAFSYCSALQNITLPNSLETLNDYVLPTNLSNIKMTEYQNAQYMGNESNPYLVLVQVKNRENTSCTIHSNTKFIAPRAFYCASLSSIVIPDGVESIGLMAFSACEKLTSVTFGKNLKVIGANAFSDCYKLKSIKLPDSLTEFGSYAFSNCRALTSVTLPKNLSVISNAAFHDCYELTNIVIPEGVTQIGSGAFDGCYELKNINIPNSVISIGAEAFSRCDRLSYQSYDTGLYLGNASNPYLVLVTTNSNTVTSCTVHEDTKLISGAFSGCQKLKKVTLSAGVSFISDGSFTNCYLKEIEFQGTVDEWEAVEKFSYSWDFSYYLNGCVVHCTDGNLLIEKD